MSDHVQSSEALRFSPAAPLVPLTLHPHTYACAGASRVNSLTEGGPHHEAFLRVRAGHDAAINSAFEQQHAHYVNMQQQQQQQQQAAATPGGASRGRSVSGASSSATDGEGRPTTTRAEQPPSFGPADRSSPARSHARNGSTSSAAVSTAAILAQAQAQRRRRSLSASASAGQQQFRAMKFLGPGAGAHAVYVDYEPGMRDVGLDMPVEASTAAAAALSQKDPRSLARELAARARLEQKAREEEATAEALKAKQMESDRRKLAEEFSSFRLRMVVAFIFTQVRRPVAWRQRTSGPTVCPPGAPDLLAHPCPPPAPTPAVDRCRGRGARGRS